MKMNNLMKQAQKMQAQMVKMQEELSKEEVEGISGGGMVKVKANGQGDILAITLEKEVVDPEDVDMLEDLILAAINDAVKKSKELANARMGKMAPGLGNLGIM